MSSVKPCSAGRNSANATRVRLFDYSGSIDCVRESGRRSIEGRQFRPVDLDS